MPLEGTRGLNARLEAIHDAADLIPEQWALLTVRYAKERVRRKTGTTGRSIRIREVRNASAVVVAGGAAAFLEGGTRPHTIVPRHAKALRWPARGTKTTLSGRATAGAVRKLGNKAYAFAKRVRHPGTRAQPFFFTSARDALDEIGVGSIIEAWNRAD